MKARVEEYVRPHGSFPYKDWFDRLDPQAAAKVTNATTDGDKASKRKK